MSASADRIAVDWIAVDWGTSTLRAWAMAGDAPCAEASAPQGMGRLAPDEFEPALMALIAPWLGDGTTPVMVCGMAGARTGWAEAPYRAAPCPAAPDGALRVGGTDPRIAVHILPGVKQGRPAEVMRGEETQIAGFVAANPDWDGTLVLPGSHAKWVQLSAREIVSFRTALSGELFAALSTQTVLRQSLGAVPGGGFDGDAFDAGVARGLSAPQTLLTDLFALRAEALLDGLSPDAARARLSGLLIGVELAGLKSYWLGAQIAVIGAPEIAGLYARAFEAQGCPVRLADATSATLAGLSAAKAFLDRAESGGPLQ